MQPTNNQVNLRNLLNDINKSLITTKEKITTALSKSYAAFAARIGGISISDPKIKEQAKVALQTTEIVTVKETRRVKSLTHARMPFLEKVKALFGKADPFMEAALTKLDEAIAEHPGLAKVHKKLEKEVLKSPSIADQLIKKEIRKLDEIFIQKEIRKLGLDQYAGEAIESRSGKHGSAGTKTINDFLHGKNLSTNLVEVHADYHTDGNPIENSAKLEAPGAFIQDFPRCSYKIEGEVIADSSTSTHNSTKGKVLYEGSKKLLDGVCGGNQRVFNNLTRLLTQGSIFDLTKHVMDDIVKYPQDKDPPFSVRGKSVSFDVGKRFFDRRLNSDVIDVTITCRQEILFMKNGEPIKDQQIRYIDTKRVITIPVDQLDAEWDKLKDSPDFIIKDSYSDLKPREHPLETFKGRTIDSSKKQHPYSGKQSIQKILGGRETNTGPKTKIIKGRTFEVPKQFDKDWHRDKFYVHGKPLISSTPPKDEQEKSQQKLEAFSDLLTFCNGNKTTFYNTCNLLTQTSYADFADFLMTTIGGNTRLAVSQNRMISLEKRLEHNKEFMVITLDADFRLQDPTNETVKYGFLNKYIHATRTITIPVHELEKKYLGEPNLKKVTPSAVVVDSYSAVKEIEPEIKRELQQEQPVEVRKVHHKHYKVPQKEIGTKEPEKEISTKEPAPTEVKRVHHSHYKPPQRRKIIKENTSKDQ